MTLFCTVARRWPSVIQNYFNSISLTWCLTPCVLFCSVRRSLYGEKKKIHARTHARTHTHITLKFWTKGDCLFFIKFTFKFSKWPSHLNAGCFNMFLLVKYGYIYSLKQVNYCAELFYKFRAVCKGKTAFDCFVSC